MSTKEEKQDILYGFIEWCMDEHKTDWMGYHGSKERMVREYLYEREEKVVVIDHVCNSCDWIHGSSVRFSFCPACGNYYE